jgi:hypothetical protein
MRAQTAALHAHAHLTHPHPHTSLLSADDKCGECSGKCLIPEKKTFEVHIEQGMRPGAKIVLRGEAGCTEPGLQPGDVVLVVQPREHETFKRPTAHDLLMEKHISLADALCGVNFQVKHLDGRIMQVRPPPLRAPSAPRQPPPRPCPTACAPPGPCQCPALALLPRPFACACVHRT